MFIGINWCGKLEHTATPKEDIDTVTVTNMICDELYASNSTNKIRQWDYYTEFYAFFKNNLLAGNVNYSATTVTSMRIKRRKLDEYKWLTLFDIPINTNADFSFERTDRYARAKTEYMYALVPVMSNNIEGNITSSTIESDFNGYFLMEKDVGYQLYIDSKIPTITKNKESSSVATLGRKYPFNICNGLSSYYTGTLTGSFIQIINCELNIDKGYLYRLNADNFLTDGIPKILKSFDGRMYMISITDNIQEDYEFYQKPVHTINWVEIGDAMSQDDLYLNGFIDVDYRLVS